MTARCPACDKRAEPGDRFCGFCGADLVVEAGDDAAVPPDQEAALTRFFIGYKRIVLDSGADAARQSLADFEAAMAVAPAMAEPYFGKALALTYVDDLKRALETLEVALSLGFGQAGDPALKFEMDEPGPDGETLEVEIGLGFALMLRGEILYGLGRSEEALEQIEALLAEGAPADYVADIQALKALILIELDRLEEAKAARDTAIMLEPNLGRLAEARGRILMEEDEPEAAIAALTDLVEHEPNDPDSYVLRGTAFDDADRVSEARTDYQTALDLLQEARAPLSRIKEVRALLAKL